MSIAKEHKAVQAWVKETTARIETVLTEQAAKVDSPDVGFAGLRHVLSTVLDNLEFSVEVGEILWARKYEDEGSDL